MNDGVYWPRRDRFFPWPQRDAVVCPTGPTLSVEAVANLDAAKGPSHQEIQSPAVICHCATPSPRVFATPARLNPPWSRPRPEPAETRRSSPSSQLQLFVSATATSIRARGNAFCQLLPWLHSFASIYWTESTAHQPFRRRPCPSQATRQLSFFSGAVTRAAQCNFDTTGQDTNPYKQPFQTRTYRNKQRLEPHGSSIVARRYHRLLTPCT
jgi:hypothetical protein